MKDGDCGIAILATATGMTYEESYELFTKKVFKEGKKGLSVGKREMEKALQLCGLEYYRVKHGKLWENVIGDYCIVDVNKKYFWFHWVIYVPSDKYLIDPYIGKEEKIYDLTDYKLAGPIFSIAKR